jgi:hypothetical protein
LSQNDGGDEVDGGEVLLAADVKAHAASISRRGSTARRRHPAHGASASVPDVEMMIDIGSSSRIRRIMQAASRGYSFSAALSRFRPVVVANG